MASVARTPQAKPEAKMRRSLKSLTSEGSA